MEALNSKERTIALLKFLGVFGVLILLIVIAAFYNFDMPTRQLKIVRAELSHYKKGYKDQTGTITALDSVSMQLFRYTTAPNQIVLEHQIGVHLGDLHEICDKDSTPYGMLVQRAVKGFEMDLVDKKNLIAAGQSAATNSEKDQLIKDLKEQLDKKEDKIEKLEDKLERAKNNN